MDITRQQAVEIILDSRLSLKSVGRGLSKEDKSKPGSTGGEWSIKDLVGHITTWEEVALEALADWKQGKTLRFLSMVSTREDLDRFNDAEVVKKRSLSWEEIDSASAELNTRLIEEIENLVDAEWNEKRKVENRTSSLGELLSRILGAPESPFGHTQAHLDELGPPRM